MPVLKSAVEAEAKAQPKEEDDYPFSGVRIESAKSGRSKCKACKEKIEADTTRVGVEVFSGGRFLVSWVHPKCFLEYCAVGYNSSGRGKCKVTKTEFAKGQLRFGYPIGQTQHGWVSVPGVSTFMPQALSAVRGFDKESIKGMAELTPEDKASMLSAMGGSTPPSKKRKRS